MARPLQELGEWVALLDRLGRALHRRAVGHRLARAAIHFFSWNFPGSIPEWELAC
jgi:hypothetical protein